MSSTNDNEENVRLFLFCLTACSAYRIEKIRIKLERLNESHRRDTMITDRKILEENVRDKI